MGASLAATCQVCGCGAATAGPTQHASEPRQPGWRTSDPIEAMSQRADVIISVCPPGSAADVAAQVAATGFNGIYVDVNAISPATSRQIGEPVRPLRRRRGRRAAGSIGGVDAACTWPATMPAEVAALWDATLLETRVGRWRCRRGIGSEGLLRCLDEGDRGAAAGDSGARCRRGRRGCAAGRVGDIDAGHGRAIASELHRATHRRRGDLPASSRRSRRASPRTNLPDGFGTGRCRRVRADGRFQGHDERNTRGVSMR